MKSINIDQLESEAVDAAISQNWSLAFDLNKQILKSEPKNVSALLRLGFAGSKIAKYTDAQHAYEAVLKLQPQNQIAIENLSKIELQKTSKPQTKSNIVMDPKIFVEHPGKTKCVTLSQLGQKVILAGLCVGEEVTISIRKRHVEVRTCQDDYIGIMPDDIGLRVTHFIEAGSEYSAYIQEANLTKVIIFVRELKKGKKVERMASFPLDIPGSIAKVQSLQGADSSDSPATQSPANDDESATSDHDDSGVEDLLEDGKPNHDDLLSDLENTKQDDNDEIIGIETEPDEDEVEE